MDASTGLMKATATLQPAVILGYIASAAAVFSSIKGAMTKSDKLTSDLGGGTSGGGSIAVPKAPTVTPSAPSFNVIGKTTAGEDQIRDAINATNKQPTIKAYVVENEMTEAQALARRAEGQASLG